jgi:hypothetical protein
MFKRYYLMRFLLAVGLLIPSLVWSSGRSDAQSDAVESSNVKFGIANYSTLDLDVRRAQTVVRSHGPTPAQLAAADQLRARVEGLEVKFNPITGTVRHLFSLSERLTAPSSVSPVEIALDFLETNLALFRLSDQEIAELAVAKNYRTQHTGVTHLMFQQFYGGLPVYQGEIKVNVDRRGQILSVNGNYYPRIESEVEPALAAAEAVALAARAIAPDLEFTLRIKSVAAGVNRATIFEQGPFTEEVTAKLVIFPIYDQARLGWNVRLHLMDRLAWYDAVVDAHTGEVLYLYNLYKFSNPEGRVFTIHPDFGPPVLKSFAGDPIASPSTWVNAFPNMFTVGNNALTVPTARSPEHHFSFPFTNEYNASGVNVFDLDNRTLRFTPNSAGGYNAELLPLSFDSDLGTDVTREFRVGQAPNANDGSLSFDLGFSFPFFGTGFSSVFVNANGYVTFGANVLDPSESWIDLILGVRRIAALWDDLNPGAARGGGVFAKRAEGRTVITWSRVPQSGQTDANTVQLTLANTGVIEISYMGVRVPDAIVGVTRGGSELDLEPVDFSARAPITGRVHGIAEKFPTRELDVAITNLFYHLNFMHDYLYDLGFDEAAGNFQANNFGRGGVGNDPVFGRPQETGFNNAFFGTAEDGRAASTGYFFFTNPPFRQVDSALDADVIYHEYVHGLTTRLVGGPFSVGALGGFQGGAMGEGWSDAYSCSITNDPVTGEYSTGNRELGIRDVNYAASPLVYGDFGNRSGPLSAANITGGIALDKTFLPEVHQDGEIWASVLWDLRTALGQATYEQLITDALKFTPSLPSMLDARDAILIADVAANGGSHAFSIWSVFAARGMGISARADNSDDTVVFQAFDTLSRPLLPGRETIFFDNMSSGPNGWTVTGDDGSGGSALWHLSTRRGAAWYYGREGIATYNTGARNFGALTSPPIALPAILSNSALVLEFDHFLRAEPQNLVRDNGYVRVVDTATGEITQVACLNNNTIGRLGADLFQHEEINLSKFAGRSVQIQFYFDTLNTVSNDFEGWYMDNVRVSRRVR